MPCSACRALCAALHNWHCSATSEIVWHCWWCRGCLPATGMKADKVRNTPVLWSLLSPITVDVVLGFPWICTGVKMDRWGRKEGQCQCQKRLVVSTSDQLLWETGVWKSACRGFFVDFFPRSFGGFFLDFLLGWFCCCFLSQHMKSDLRLQIKSGLFLESIKPLQQALYL